MVLLSVMGEAVLQAPQGRLTPAASRVFSLALLLLLDREHPWERDELVGLVWPDASPSNGRHNLRQALYRLRMLGIPVSATGERISLAPDVVIRSNEPLPEEPAAGMSDAIVSGTRKVGQFLGGYDPSFSPLLREWVEERRAQAHARVRVVLVQCLEHLRRAARWSELEQMSTLMLEFDPLNETATLFRAEVAALSGDKVGALRMLSEYAEEVGQVNRDLAIPAKILRRRVSEQFHATSTTAQPTLVGRNNELQLFYRFIELVRQRRAKTLTVLGRHGIGKSRLLEEFLYVAQTQGFSTASTRFDIRDQQKPFSSIILLLATLMELPGALALSPNTLEFVTQVTSGELEPPTSPEAERKLGIAVGELLATVSEENRLIFALDDIDNADVRSLGALRHTVPHLQLGEIGFVLSTSSATAAAESFVLDLESQVTTKLSSLDIVAAQQLTRSIIGASAPTEVVDWVVDRSGGSPLHISILATHWEVTRVCSTPLSLTDTLRLALAERSSQALRLLHLISAARLCRNIGCLQQLAGHSLNEMYDLLSELETANLLAVRDGAIVLTYPLIADVVANLNGRAANAVIHRIIALHLEAEHTDSAPHNDAWERAYHWLAAGDVAKASEAVRYCLRDLWRAGLPRETAQMALSLVSLSSSPQQRRRIVNAILTALDEGGNWAELINLARRLPPSAGSSGTEVEEQVSSAFAEFRQSGDAATALRTLWTHVVNKNAAPSARVLAADHAMRIAEVNLDRPTLESLFGVVRPLLSEPSVPRRSALVCETVFHCSAGSLDHALRSADSLVHDSRESADPVTLSRALRFRSSVHERRSNLADARTDLDEALKLAQQAEANAVVSIVISRLLEISIESGDAMNAEKWFTMQEQTNATLALDKLSERAHALLHCRFKLSRSNDALPPRLREQIVPSLPMTPRRELLQTQAILLEDAIRRSDTRAVGRLARTMQKLWADCRPNCAVDYAACALTLGLHALGDDLGAQSFLDAHIESRREPHPIHPGILTLIPSQITYIGGR